MTRTRPCVSQDIVMLSSLAVTVMGGRFHGKHNATSLDRAAARA
jgi:hypothetical protein